MSTMGYWLSKQEKVEVETVIKAQSYQKYTNSTFRIKRLDGTIEIVDRRDLILQEEESLIEELAHILYHSKNPARNGRYAEIIRHFLSKGVPYVIPLQAKKPTETHQQSLNLDDAG